MAEGERDRHATAVGGWLLISAMTALAAVSIAAATAIAALIANERRAPVPVALSTPERNPDRETIEARVESLRQRLQAAPDDLEGWKMLGRSLQALGRHGDAVGAYSQAAKLAPNNAETQAALARLSDIARTRGAHPQ
ncbi:MAG: tetratricopeptide repeat protein [Alphaproteobacteria bacterium]|nr:tetratricopeptide repeat protein [Alphaproteobacteria bacterium]